MLLPLSQRLVKQMEWDDSHHWVGLRPDPSKFFGFIYSIHHLSTGKRYIGKKQYWFSAGKKGQRVKDLNNPKWNRLLWKDSDWRFYTSSSKDLNAAIKECGKDDFEFTILSQHSNSRDLHYSEVEALVDADALVLVDEDGAYVYYNKSIPDVKFRPPTTVTEAWRAAISDSLMGRTKGAELYEGRACRKCGNKTRYKSTRNCVDCQREKGRSNK